MLGILGFSLFVKKKPRKGWLRAAREDQFNKARADHVAGVDLASLKASACSLSMGVASHLEREFESVVTRSFPFQLRHTHQTPHLPRDRSCRVA